MAQDLRDFYLNHDDLVIGNEQLDQMAVGDLYGALKKKHHASHMSKALFQFTRSMAMILVAWASIGPIEDFMENDPTKKRDNFDGPIAMGLLGVAVAGVSAVAFLKYKKNDAAARNLNDAYLMKIKPKDRAQAESESLYPGAIDGLVARGFVRQIEKFEYNS